MPGPGPSVVGYIDPWTARPGDTVNLHVSADVPQRVGVEVIRVDCSDKGRTGFGFLETLIDEVGELEAVTRPVRAGSYLEFPVALPEQAALQITIWPTSLRGRRQAVFGTWNESKQRGILLAIDETNRVTFTVGDGERVETVRLARPLVERRWVRLTATSDPETGRLQLRQMGLAHSAGIDAVVLDDLVTADVAPGLKVGDGGPPLLAGAWFALDGFRSDDGEQWTTDGHFDGKVETPRISVGAELIDADPEDTRWEFSWDLAVTIDSDQLVETNLGANGRTRQMPVRAATGSNWTGAIHDWRQDPSQYGAIHLHSDDQGDVDWPVELTWTVPADLPSAVYAMRLTAADGDIDRIPFWVVPPIAEPGQGAPVAYLASTATYQAYSNQLAPIVGMAALPGERSRRKPNREQQWVLDHPEVGGSHYEVHRDRSGVHFSSRLRPTMNIRPGAEPWSFSPDTNIHAFLDREGHDWECLTDDALHRDGIRALRPHRVLITGAHPEYWSTPMMNALRQWQAEGGRLVYMGGNGFYWRVAWNDDTFTVMEVRRAEDGTRAWLAEPGEYHHQFGGELGGLWRRIGHPPNQVCGIGFAAQGFDRGAPYHRAEGSNDPRASWIFEGVESDDILGDWGPGGGAAGQEIDRFEPMLGSPGHGIVLATAVGEFTDQMLRTLEELGMAELPHEDPDIRADMVFYETVSGGAVFSTGSISYAGALAHNDGRNDIARITANVLRRFVDPTPFIRPDPDTR
ncbi:MAG: LamG domain-containing protein [Actinomycetia bacterium]|nr:LamG domain-containing protein [Actinomycetes bacterium]